MLARLLPEGTTLSETLDAVESAFDSAQGVNLGPTAITDPDEFKRPLNEARAADSLTLTRLRNDIEAIDAADSGDSRLLAELSCAAVDRGPDLPAILGFLKTTDEWLTERLGQPSHGTSAGDAAAVKVQEMIRRWRKAVGAQ